MNCIFEDDPDDLTKLRCKNGCGLRVPIRLKGQKIHSECRVLSKFQKAKNYSKHFLQHKITGSKETPSNLATLRREICNSCRHLNKVDDSCLFCGCFLKPKISWLEQECPVYKWPKNMGMLYTSLEQDLDTPVNLKNIYKNATCFFIGGGPSLNNIDLSFLQKRGFFSFAVNNIAARNVKPNFWCSADDPKSFHENIWRDPTILKFVRRNNYYKIIRTGEYVRDMPGVIYFDINEDFDPNTFLTESTFNFGNHSDTYDELGNKGGRCVMLLSLKLIYYLGFRKVYLLGCDFHMNEEQPYAFEQHKWSGGVRSNNDKFRIINERLKLLQPKFQENNFQIYNCTQDSKLDAFLFKDLNKAIEEVNFDFDLNPNLSEMYGENKK